MHQDYPSPEKLVHSPAKVGKQLFGFMKRGQPSGDEVLLQKRQLRLFYGVIPQIAELRDLV